MSTVHRIRLRGPWEVTALTRVPADQPLPAPTRMTMPCRWRDGGWPGFAGAARHVRRFGKPSNLAAGETVWLMFAGATGDVTVRLNGVAVDAWADGHGPAEIDVTSLLNDRNELQVVVQAPGDDGGLWGEVALEIRAAGT